MVTHLIPLAYLGVLPGGFAGGAGSTGLGGVPGSVPGTGFGGYGGRLLRTVIFVMMLN